MKKKLFILLLLLSVTIYAQRPQNGGGRSPQNQQGEQTQKAKKFKASDAVGLFYYDIDEVVKKLKVKDDALRNKVSKVLRDYNHKIKEISFLNSEKFDSLDAVVNSMSS